ncbi:MAG: ribonuclease J [Sphaerobacter thermophilus]|uniref:Ribonuclease J n=1 Tax=Sphaerobacter thermophilus (strain ATCC 49802 / DSM 20745 / KCCM 41009 / NCIMB 13125 / S 6022) TaxID=479434 RepID=D1C6Z6_SPHTD|nr:ribonuclease J [Sphaerobacter thermophilus]ACZ37757.1 beta-lactamase domain protein [Sphaerobacter thermophilus DSM 20745]PZN61732.1 MAG: RNase J family beta-CASP ribonuclease [Sphaerobacter thermophilus]
MARPRVRVIPLGGVGEVGKNLTVYEYRGDLVMIDAGAKFPEEEMRGVDLIVPDITYVKERVDRLRGILITHGHEDHIGGLPYLLPQLKSRAPIPLYGSALAMAYAEAKLDEAGVLDLAEFHVVEPGQHYQLGRYLTAEFVPVTHSIPGSFAVALRTPLGWAVHTGDFKFDPTPPLGPPTDEARLRELGNEGVLLLLSDAVRVERPGHTPSEAVVSETLYRVIGEAKGRVVLTTFASNITRIDQAIRAAYRHGRKVAISGRSMEQSTRIAQDLGYMKPPPDTIIPLDVAVKLPREQVLFLTTGSQGEASAALARIASGEHPAIKLQRGDTVIFSATPVPGNEDTVSQTIDQLFRRGVSVVYSAIEPTIHVSGHASRDELRFMLRLLRPRFVVPIHGEYRHLALYRELALEMGYNDAQVLLPEIGNVLSFGRDSGRREQTVESGAVLVDIIGNRNVILRQRDEIAASGVIIATMIVDRDSRQLIAGPDVSAQGLDGQIDAKVLKRAEDELRRFLEKRQKGGFSYGYLVSRTKNVLSRQIYRDAKIRPMILPVISEL